MKVSNFSVALFLYGIDLATGRVNGQTDDMAKTFVVINADEKALTPATNDYDFVIANGDELVIGVPSGTLIGTVANLPAIPMLVDCTWQGSYGGLVGRRCAIGGWELNMYEAVAVSSTYPGAISWDLYEIALTVVKAAGVNHFSSPSYGEAKQRIMADFLAWFAANAPAAERPRYNAEEVARYEDELARYAGA